jgi:hypothetical protein
MSGPLSGFPSSVPIKSVMWLQSTVPFWNSGTRGGGGSPPRRHLFACLLLCPHRPSLQGALLARPQPHAKRSSESAPAEPMRRRAFYDRFCFRKVSWPLIGKAEPHLVSPRTGRGRRADEHCVFTFAQESGFTMTRRSLRLSRSTSSDSNFRSRKHSDSTRSRVLKRSTTERSFFISLGRMDFSQRLWPGCPSLTIANRTSEPDRFDWSRIANTLKLYAIIHISEGRLGSLAWKSSPIQRLVHRGLV